MVKGGNKKRGRVCEEGQDSNSKWGDVPFVGGVDIAGRAGSWSKTTRILRTSTMASSRRVRIALFLLVLTCDAGVFGRAVHTRGFLSQPVGPALRADAERCAELVAPWQENARPAPEEEENATRLQLRVRPFSPRASRGLLFPGKTLFSFVRRVYRCCQERLSCRSVKGIPGRLRGGEWVHIQHVLVLGRF